MDWTGIRGGRVLAGVYLLAFVGLYGGPGCDILAQWTGPPQLAVGGFVFVGSIIAMVVLSSALRSRVPAPAGWPAARSSNTTRAYRRLTLGAELGRAWRVLLG
ncbi:hypothetical protein GCM10009630_29030 [Kribbella jejuensis]|uniref:MFS transporter n=1 Tax=Kribbella jejuensis TaxID=236068 RepID=A0A542EQ01_9ACTN|nr:hypothetical protein [Kribbella jejuensis]TQJ17405.1 hypothetical protein FB475_1523 [Kribbella jejuensis]